MLPTILIFLLYCVKSCCNLLLVRVRGLSVPMEHQLLLCKMYASDM